MARRSKTSPWDGLIDLVGGFPWWVGLALAPLAYLLIHTFTGPPAGLPTPGHASTFVLKTFVSTMAGIFQYVVPVLCLMGSALSAWKRRHRQALAAQVTRSDSADALNGMSWERFEQLVSEAFRRQGYAVRETGGGGADGGVDLELRKGSELHLVQCKQWKAYKVGVEVVRELYGVMAARGAAGGFVVTSGTFTDPAREFAKGRNVHLVDGTRLRALLATAAATRATPAAAVRPTAPQAEPTPPAQPANATSGPPSCPLCAKQMIKRTASRGPNQGKAFWGCAGYPACRGTRAV
jgi:restriction system protein